MLDSKPYKLRDNRSTNSSVPFALRPREDTSSSWPVQDIFGTLLLRLGGQSSAGTHLERQAVKVEEWATCGAGDFPRSPAPPVTFPKRKILGGLGTGSPISELKTFRIINLFWCLPVESLMGTVVVVLIKVALNAIIKISTILIAA